METRNNPTYLAVTRSLFDDNGSYNPSKMTKPAAYAILLSLDDDDNGYLRYMADICRVLGVTEDTSVDELQEIADEHYSTAFEYTTEAINKPCSIHEIMDEAKENAYIDVFYKVYGAFYGKEAAYHVNLDDAVVSNIPYEAIADSLGLKFNFFGYLIQN